MIKPSCPEMSMDAPMLHCIVDSNKIFKMLYKELKQFVKEIINNMSCIVEHKYDNDSTT